MAHISTGVEYGLHCLLYLAETPAGVKEASVRDLAEMQGVSTDYLAKLFTKLAKAELVVATEGVRGGFALARPAKDITVAQVVEAIDGDKALFDCREVRSRCAVFNDQAPDWATRGVCSIHAVMQAAESALQEELQRHTLADLAHRTLAKAPASYGRHVVKWFAERSAGRRGEDRG
ncbi:Rrf2 family transcriptional regulator [Paraburkholderia sp. DHOC27]|uniref:RrF2 family transcriptional regulator n=1 Tax=Paraburkholderia sp. DHOC27 TaxID=2303330 RepID=UPI000E3C9F67|nr:Rrf2 family transcriptional regulator [Paraburkholderia sp. DHOC27]RFU49285.1 Rrf2 family transcriptional regulator [Paraburkholderia sp. DHOC27]